MALLLLALALAGSVRAQASGPDKAAGGGASDGSASLTVWTTFRGAALGWLQAEAGSFERAFGTGVVVVPRTLGEIKQGAMTLAKKGGAADVFVGVGQEQFSALAEAGILADVGSYATPGYLADLSPQARQAFRYRGVLYGLPLSLQGPALIVDTRLVPDPPRDYPQLLSLAASLTGDGHYGFAFDLGNLYYAYAWLHSFGGSVFARGPDGAPDPARLRLATPGAVQGAEALRALRFGDGLVPAGADYAALHRLFLDGKLAMTYDGPWAVPDMRAAGIPIAVLPMPPLADGTRFRGFMNVDGVLIDHYSTQPVAAANLAKWLTTRPSQVGLARRAGRIPASTAALAQLDDPVTRGFGKALAHAEAVPNLPAMGAVWGPMDRALATILASKDSDVAAALAKAVDAIAAEVHPTTP